MRIRVETYQCISGEIEKYPVNSSCFQADRRAIALRSRSTFGKMQSSSGLNGGDPGYPGPAIPYYVPSDHLHSCRFLSSLFSASTNSQPPPKLCRMARAPVMFTTTILTSLDPYINCKHTSIHFASDELACRGTSHQAGPEPSETPTTPRVLRSVSHRYSHTAITPHCPILCSFSPFSSHCALISKKKKLRKVPVASPVCLGHVSVKQTP